MIINAVSVSLSLITALFMGWAFMIYFRKQKTGVKSPYIPDGKKLSEDKKTIGTAFACFVGALISLLACGSFFDGGFFESISCVVFIGAMCFLGYKDDKQLFFTDKRVGIKTENRLLSLTIVSLLFGIMLMASGRDTIIGVPFTLNKIRLSGAFGIVLMIMNVVFSEGERKTGLKNNSEYVRGAIKLTAVITVCALKEQYSLMLMPSLLLGAIAGGIFWFDIKRVFKTGYSDKNFISAVVLSACIMTKNEEMLLFVFGIEILSLISQPVDMFFYKITKKHIFNRLPVDEHLISCNYNIKKIKIFYVITELALCIMSVLISLLLLKTS